MKKVSILLILITLISCCLCFTSCGASTEEKHYEECIEKLRDSLIDPTSLLIAEAESYTDKDTGDIYYRIKYNAKNRLGAYVGNETVYFKYDAEDKNISRDSIYSTSFSLTKALDGKHKVYVK